LSSLPTANKPASVVLWPDQINQAYNGELGDEAGRKARDRINWMCAQAQGETVLDIGCSQGITTLLLAREGFRTVGIDISEDAIAYARAEQQKELPSVAERIEFIWTDLSGLDAARQFDTVIMGEVLEHQAHTERFLKTAARHVKAGGVLVVTVPFGLHPFPDHKATIFPRDLIDILGDEFSVKNMEVQESYIRFTGVKNGGADAASLAQVLKLTESGAVRAQQKYFDLHAKFGAANKKILDWKKAADERAKELTTATANRQKLELAQAKLQASVSELEAAAKAATEARDAATRERDEQTGRLREQLAAVTAGHDELQAALAKVQRERDALSAEHGNQVGQLHAELGKAEAKARELEAALQTVQAEKETLTSALHEARAASRVLDKDHEQRLQQLQADLDATTQQRDAAKKQLAQLRTAETAARSAHADEVKRLKAAMAEREQAAAQRRIAENKAQLAKIAALEQRIERDAELMARKQAGLEMSAMAVRKTLSFQLGNLLINGFKSPRNFVRLPGALLALRGEAKTRRQSRREKGGVADETFTGTSEKGKPVEVKFDTVLDLFNAGGVPAVTAFLADKNLKPAAAATLFTQLARHLQSVVPAKAAEAAREANNLDPQPYRAKWLAFRLFEAGFVVEPGELLAGLTGTTGELSVSEQRRAEEIGALTRLRKAFPQPEQIASPSYSPVPNSLLYVAASALPYHTSGYTIRTHELVRAMVASGLDVTVLTRPGYPWDRPDSKGEPQNEQTVVDGVPYLHRTDPSQAIPLDVYFDEAARAIAAVAKEKRVAVIHAASNHVNALPAMLAARSLGIPFVYEMRGVWELSRASKLLDYETSERFQIGIDLEAFVAKNADRVYVISHALGSYIETWGVDAARIALLPNCVNPDTIRKTESAQADKIAEVFTVGYAGAMVGYEGLDVLVEAIALLKARGQRVDARLIGDGDMRPALESLVAERGLGDQIEFLGKLAPPKARLQLAVTNAVAIPRKAHHVCEIVPPIKLVEAMALGMPVVVPNLPVFCEEVRDDDTGVLFKAGDAADLANAIERLIGDPQRVIAMGERARAHVSRERVWRRFTDQMRAEAGAGQLESLYGDGGVEAVIQAVDKQFGTRKKEAATELLRIGRLLNKGGHQEAEYPLAMAALANDRSESTLRGAFWVTQRARDFGQSCEIILEIERIYGEQPNPTQQEFLDKLRASPAYLLSVLKAAQPRQPDRIDSIPDRVCYVLHNTLPYSSGGYATRSHGVATGIRDAGFDVVVLSRPGFPLDIKPELTEADVVPIDTVDGIQYVRTLAPLRAGLPVRAYILAAADALEARLREYRPSIVIAASNHVTALPALIAARRLGLPFIYEVRGLWEITRLSRDTAFGESPAFHVQRLLEAGVAELADHVFTLTEPMREELVERGVKYDRIDLLPNSCDPTRFEPVKRNEELAATLQIPAGVPVIGYIGTFVDYEGLEDLAAACGLLKQRGIEFRLLMVGNENASGQTRGPITEEIVRIAEEMGFSDWLIMTGRVPHELVEDYYSLVDVAPFPRKPLPVCEMVSPMKPLEALAMEKAVVVSSVRALVEMVQDGQTGLVFEKGSTESLAKILTRLIDSPDLRMQLGAEGRRWVERERTWSQVGRKAGSILSRIVAARHAGAA
jgi:glycosyltransferase involved in cell wall biosynthesis/SAM-dependent methyltransferase